MKTSHLQSMIAINANRITAKHNAIEDAIASAKQFRKSVVSSEYQQYVDMAVEKAYKIADKQRKELKKAVEMQKSLQAELRANREAEMAAKPSKEFIPVFYTNGEEGWSCSGVYCVEVISEEDYVCHYFDGKTTNNKSPGFAKLYASCKSFTAHAKMPVMIQKPGEYNILKDGQPKKDGVYSVKYSAGSDIYSRYFKECVWYCDESCSEKAGFGNYTSDLQHESYIVE